MSNIFGALYLSRVDEYFDSQKGIFYIRYMDDILIMSHSKFKLRRSLKAIYRLMKDLNVEIHRGNEAGDLLWVHLCPMSHSAAIGIDGFTYSVEKARGLLQVVLQSGGLVLW